MSNCIYCQKEIAETDGSKIEEIKKFSKKYFHVNSTMLCYACKETLRIKYDGMKKRRQPLTTTPTST